MAGIEETVGGAVDITRRDWTGLPWEINPNSSRDADWVQVMPGTYYLDRIEDGWVYLRLGGVKVKLDAAEARVHWPNI